MKFFVRGEAPWLFIDIYPLCNVEASLLKQSKAIAVVFSNWGSKLPKLNKPTWRGVYAHKKGLLHFLLMYYTGVQLKDKKIAHIRIQRAHISCIITTQTIFIWYFLVLLYKRSEYSVRRRDKVILFVLLHSPTHFTLKLSFFAWMAGSKKLNWLRRHSQTLLLFSQNVFDL